MNFTGTGFSAWVIDAMLEHIALIALFQDYKQLRLSDVHELWQTLPDFHLTSFYLVENDVNCFVLKLNEIQIDNFQIFLVEL